VKIETEKTHSIILSDGELNKLRCFIGDALEDTIWREFPEDLKFIQSFHDMALDAWGG
jgi:cob(I)alamin adenosyltransferase